MRAVESLVLAVTILILEESVIAPLPDDAVTSVSELELELEAVEVEEELLSSLFAQPIRIRLTVTRIPNKLIALFIIPLIFVEKIEIRINKTNIGFSIDCLN